MAKNKKENITLELTQEEIERQQNLSPERLAIFNPKYSWSLNFGLRPKESLIELMNWTKETFGKEISDKPKDLQSFIHNKIIMDGSFLQYAEENGLKIECVYRDSLASWQMERKFEHFLTQGVFKITVGDISFLHAALFHKGSQNEDEVSFFILIEDKNFFKYLNIRNDFDEWLKKRDRMNMEVHVVGGESYSYDRDVSWDDVFLPAKLKKDIRLSVEGFLNSEHIYKENKIPYKKGLIFWGEPGTGKSTLLKVIMSNYTFKPITVSTSSHTNDDTITEAFQYAQEQAPGLLFMEDLDTLIGGRQITLSHLLNLLDGVKALNGVFIVATANNLSALAQAKAITDRPSRFDQKFHIPLPSKSMAKEYLKKWFKDLISDDDYERLAARAKESKFSYAHLKDLYIRAAYQAISNNRERPNKDDIKLALQELIIDKQQAEEEFNLEEDQTKKIDIE